MFNVWDSRYITTR